MTPMSVPTLLERIGRTPLVRLVRLGAGLPVPVYAKCEHLQPGGSVKDRIALAIVADAERRGLLRPGATLAEATAGRRDIDAVEAGRAHRDEAQLRGAVDDRGGGAGLVGEEH